MASPATDAFQFAPLEPVAMPLPAAAAPAEPEIDLERIRAEARAEGYTQGAADARSVIDPAAEALQQTAAQLAVLRDALAEETEHAAVELALRIAAQAIQGVIAVEPERVVDVVRGGLRRLIERERVIVLVSPEDLDVVREHAPDLIAELGGIEHLEVQADRRVGRGGAMVRTGEAEVDATLETKLARVRELISEELGAAREDASA